MGTTCATGGYSTLSTDVCTHKIHTFTCMPNCRPNTHHPPCLAAADDFLDDREAAQFVQEHATSNESMAYDSLLVGADKEPTCCACYSSNTAVGSTPISTRSCSLRSPHHRPTGRFVRERSVLVRKQVCDLASHPYARARSRARARATAAWGGPLAAHSLYGGSAQVVGDARIRADALLSPPRRGDDHGRCAEAGAAAQGGRPGEVQCPGDVRDLRHWPGHIPGGSRCGARRQRVRLSRIAPLPALPRQRGHPPDTRVPLRQRHRLPAVDMRCRTAL